MLEEKEEEKDDSDGTTRIRVLTGTFFKPLLAFPERNNGGFVFNISAFRFISPNGLVWDPLGGDG